MSAPHPYLFPPLQETLSVFQGRVRLLRDLTLAGGKDLAAVLRSADPTLTIHDQLDQQVCSDSVCYSPRAAASQLDAKVRPLER